MAMASNENKTQQMVHSCNQMWERDSRSQGLSPRMLPHPRSGSMWRAKESVAVTTWRMLVGWSPTHDSLCTSTWALLRSLCSVVLPELQCYMAPSLPRWSTAHHHRQNCNKTISWTLNSPHQLLMPWAHPQFLGEWEYQGYLKFTDPLKFVFFGTILLRCQFEIWNANFLAHEF
jgi:hypothetical protein